MNEKTMERLFLAFWCGAVPALAWAVERMIALL